jgi:hypothetical protein
MPEDIARIKQRSVQIDGKTYYVAEGDLLLDEQELQRYVAKGPAAPADVSGKPPHELLGILEGGKIIRWKPGLELTYAVKKDGFSEEELQTVVASVKQATSDWEKTCGVKFRAVDEGSTPAPLFSVRRLDSLGRFIAAAFFPNDPVSRRLLVIDPSFFTTSFDSVGVLRHELGHVLGFRHEHIRSGAPPVCPAEDTADTIDLSKYDPKSVMHYFCGNVGDQKLRISDVDREASQRLYGPPLDQVTYFE